MPKGIYPRSEEQLEKIRKVLKKNRRTGPFSEESKLRCSLAQIGNKNALGLKRTQENKDKISKARKDIPSPLRGRELPTEARLKRSIIQKKRVAEGRHNFWKGGINKINLKIRGSLEYKLWRESVFKRDDYTCQECQQRGGTLNADHIKPFSQYSDLRFEITNGRTLCVMCHRKTPTWGMGALTKTT